MMIVVYVGDAKDVIKRIRWNHCGGNVEASALRRHIAERMGYPIIRTKRSSGSTRVRIDLPDPKTGEQDISAYLRKGIWRFVLCDSPWEAQDFQWYVIDVLKPLLNVLHMPWDRENSVRYQALITVLTTAPGMNYEQLKKITSGPGVYVLFHEKTP